MQKSIIHPLPSCVYRSSLSFNLNGGCQRRGCGSSGRNSYSKDGTRIHCPRSHTHLGCDSLSLGERVRERNEAQSAKKGSHLRPIIVLRRMPVRLLFCFAAASLPLLMP